MAKWRKIVSKSLIGLKQDSLIHYKRKKKILKQRTIVVGKWKVYTPTVWLGHDLKHPLNVWTKLKHFPGLMLNAYQIIKRPSVRKRAINQGLRSYLGYSGPIFMDSGGFLFQRDGKCKVKVDDISALYKDLLPDIAAILDIPLDPLASNQNNYRRWRTTVKCTTYMAKNCTYTKLAPVFHAYSLSAIKRRYEELQKILPNPDVICIGSLVPLLRASYIGERFINKGCSRVPTYQRWNFITKLILKIRSMYPNSMLHVFGVGSLSTMYLLFMLGIDSVDSVAWRLKAAYGEIQVPGSLNCCINPRPNVRRTRRRLKKEDIDQLEKCTCPVCIGRGVNLIIKDLTNSFVHRALHNVHTCISEVQALRLEISRGSYIDFVERRLQRSDLYHKILLSIILPQIRETHS